MFKLTMFKLFLGCFIRKFSELKQKKPIKHEKS
jgi:hypothetical protein